MARPSKLTQVQCQRIRMLKNEGETAPALAERFKLSESSVYKILNGSYTAAPSDANSLPPLVEPEYMGSTPSIFYKTTAQDQQMASRVRKAADASGQVIDEVTLAAAELIIARARYARALGHDR